jgi:hypothetical protein
MYPDNDEMHFRAQEYGRRVDEFLTPSVEDQLVLVLAGECPHNRGWSYHAHGHNSSAYKCNLCGKIDWY